MIDYFGGEQLGGVCKECQSRTVDPGEIDPVLGVEMTSEGERIRGVLEVNVSRRKRDPGTVLTDNPGTAVVQLTGHRPGQHQDHQHPHPQSGGDFSVITSVVIVYYLK